MYAKDLIWKVILRAEIYDDEPILTFTDGVAVMFQPWGECCNTVWIEHIDGSAALAPGATILSLEQLVDGATNERDEEDHIIKGRTWGERIVTDRGICTIELRNDYDAYAYQGDLNIIEVVAGSSSGAKPLKDF